MLEDRQKQMMELWQSDTDDENDEQKSDDEKTGEKENDDNKISKAEVGSVDVPKEIESITDDAKDLNMHISSEDNDKLFDDILSKSIIEETNRNILTENESIQVESTNNDNVTEEQNSETNMKLVFNDSETSITESKQDHTDNVEEDTAIEKIENSVNESAVDKQQDSECAKVNTVSNSQIISLCYDSEKLESFTETAEAEQKSNTEGTETSTEKTSDSLDNIDKETETMDVDNGFSDDDMNIEDIDNIIENAEIIRGEYLL